MSTLSVEDFADTQLSRRLEDEEAKTTPLLVDILTLRGLPFGSSLFRTVLIDCSRALACTLRLGTDKGLEMGDTIFGDDFMCLGPLAKGSPTFCGTLFVSLEGTGEQSGIEELGLTAERVV